jgi:dUTP pyrophosphatase
MNLKVKALATNATLPNKANPWDAGFDIYINEDVSLVPGWVIPTGTGIAVEIPPGYVGFLTIRSSLGKRGVQLANAPGVIDAGYRGEVKLLLTLQEAGSDRVELKAGDKIAQLVIVPIPTMGAEWVDELGESDGRGEGGFGSTGRV